jgi:hypothetical protein
MTISLFYTKEFFGLRSFIFIHFVGLDLLFHDILDALNIGMSQILIGHQLVSDHLLDFFDFRESTFGGAVKKDFSVQLNGLRNERAIK